MMRPRLLLPLLFLIALTPIACNKPTLLGQWPPAVSAAPGEQVSSYGDGVPSDPRAAARWYQAEAERGVPEAQFNLGVMYSRGEGVRRNPAKATRWLRLAEAQGIRQARAPLGRLYAAGEIPDATALESEGWLMAAAFAGDAEAQERLGDRYASVQPVPAAPEPLEKRETLVPPPTVPSLQTPEEQLALGDRYRDGEGVRRDLLYAARLYARAAESGLPAAQARLGNAYHQGIGVPRDYLLSYKWLSLATAAGSPEAHEKLELVEAKLPSERVLEAQSLARDWYTEHVASEP